MTVEMFEELSVNIRQWFCWLYANSLTEVCELRDFDAFYLSCIILIKRYYLDDDIVSVCFGENVVQKEARNIYTKHVFFIFSFIIFWTLNIVLHMVLLWNFIFTIFVSGNCKFLFLPVIGYTINIKTGRISVCHFFPFHFQIIYFP